MASPAAEAIAREKAEADRAAREHSIEQRLGRIERKLDELLSGKTGKAADTSGDVEPYEVPESKLDDAPVLVPVAKASDAKKK